jgi:hypothetical protein
MMEEPKRMLDQTTSARERALLQEGRAYVAPEELRAHTLAALGLAGSAGVAGGLLAWLSAKAWPTKIILALSTMTLLAAIPLTYVFFGKDALPARPASPAPAVVPVPVAPPSPPAAVAEPAPAPPSTAAAPAVLPAEPARGSAATSSALRAELAALDAVRSTLANDDPAGALSFLTAYFRTFPRGRLHLEAEVLRIDALAKAGRVEVAQRNAQDFLKRHPNSVLAARVRPYAER